MKASWRYELPRLVIIAPGYNCSDTVQLFVNSLQIQNYTNWKCICIDDASTDDTFDKLKLWVGNDKRFTLIRNEVNKGALRNRYDAMDIKWIENNDICIYFDLDDWFGTKYALEYLIKEYAVRDILVTTARNHCLRDGYEHDALLYTDRQQLLDADHHCFSLFSYQAKLWRSIPRSHFIDPRTGDFYMMDSDPCFTFPILWMAGPERHHHLFVDNLIIYNNIRPICDDYKYGDEGHKEATKLILESFHKLVESKRI